MSKSKKSNLLNSSEASVSESSTLGHTECIVTGFDPFGGIALNPSQMLVENLPDAIELEDAKIKLTKMILPTCCKEAWKKLSRTLSRKKSKPVSLVMLGLADDRRAVSLERVALNLRDYTIEDNLGHRHPFGKIDENFENALFSELRLESMIEKLSFARLPLEVSYHAGTFVCNEIYFQSLKYQKENDHLRSALFVHVPNINTQNASTKLDAMQEIVTGIIKELVLEQTS